MFFVSRVDRRIWWLIVLKVADRLSKISIEDLDFVFVSFRVLIIESKVVLVECLFLKLDWLLLRRLFCVRKVEIWLNIVRLSVFVMKGRREIGL